MARDAAEPLDDPARPEPRAYTRFDRGVLRVSGWLAEHTTIRLIVAVTALLLALAPGAILLFASDDFVDSVEGFSYAGVFLTNLASTATFYFPVPGLTAAAQALITTESEDSIPWLVGIAGGLGMALGEVTAYYGGYLGAELVRGREMPGPERLRAWAERIVRRVNWLMDRWGMATLFVLSAIPNPLFEVAGLTAGSVRMPFRRFFVAVTAGKIVRGLLLAYFGDDVWDGATAVLPFL
jgi:membrane protein DedA with SNARE-associated domain